jgi:hypothetical protein
VPYPKTVFQKSKNSDLKKRKKQLEEDKENRGERIPGKLFS